MFWYLIIFCALSALALVERGQMWPGIVAALILAVVCSLRYETGFDWVEYETHYYYAPGLFDSDLYASVSAVAYEPGFEFLNRLLRTFGADFQWLIFVVGAFNLAVLYRLIQRFSPLVSIVLLVYFGFVFLSGQMAEMRQTLSISFIYLAFIRRNDGKTTQATFLCLAALTIHAVSIIFVPLVFVTVRPWKAQWLAVVCLLGFAASVYAGNLFTAVADTMLQFMNEGAVADRLEIYSSIAGVSISPISVALALLHIGFVWVAQRRRADTDYIVRAAIWAAWLSVILHSWFAPFSILWNRAMLVTLPLEVIALCRIYYVDLGRLFFRLRAVAVAGAGSLLALLYALSGDQALVYEPYQSLAVVWVRGPYGNGRLRYQLIRNENDAIAIRQKVR